MFSIPMCSFSTHTSSPVSILSFAPTANSNITVQFDPATGINIQCIYQVFQNLATQKGHSNVRNGLDQEVNDFARWAQMNPTLYGDKEATERSKKAFATTTVY